MYGLRRLDGVGETYDATLHKVDNLEDRITMNDLFRENDQASFSANNMKMEQQQTCCCNDSNTRWWKYGLVFLGGALFCHLLKLGEPKHDKGGKNKSEKED